MFVGFAGEESITWRYFKNNCFVVSAADIVFELDQRGYLGNLLSQKEVAVGKHTALRLWCSVCYSRVMKEWDMSNADMEQLVSEIRNYFGWGPHMPGCSEDVVDLLVSFYIGDSKMRIVKRCSEQANTQVLTVTRGLMRRSFLVQSGISVGKWYLARHTEPSVCVEENKCNDDDEDIVFLDECKLEFDGSLPRVLFLRRDPSPLIVRGRSSRQKPTFVWQEVLDVMGSLYTVFGAVLYETAYACDERGVVKKAYGQYVKAFSHYKSMTVNDTLPCKCVTKDCMKCSDLLEVTPSEFDTSVVSLLVLVKSE